MLRRASNPPAAPATRRLWRGIALFVTLSVAGLALLLHRGRVDDLVAGLRRASPAWLALAAGMWALDVVLAGVRIWIFARTVERPATFATAVRSCLVNVFVGGVTPSQTGGGPAQIWVLWRAGMPAVDATIVCFLGGFFGTSVVLAAMAAAFVGVAPGVIDVAPMRHAARASAAAFALVTAFVVVSVAAPGAVRRAGRALLGADTAPARAARRRGWDLRVRTFVERYLLLLHDFVVRRPRLVLAGLALSALIYLNKFAIAWVVLRALGLNAPPGDVIVMQVALLLIFYFSPTPGASGLAEVSTAAVMGAVIPPADRVAFIVLWRFFTLVLGMIAGAGVMARLTTSSPTPKRNGGATGDPPRGRGGGGSVDPDAPS